MPVQGLALVPRINFRNRGKQDNFCVTDNQKRQFSIAT
jgi:hypothetical protein